MRVCVVGGTGNISLSIVKTLLAQDHEVTCFNRGHSGEPGTGAGLITGDRLDREAFEKTMQAQNFDAAIDMVCFNREDALSDIRAFRGVSHFIHVSTTCTYGVDYDWMPVTEDHPLRPVTDYGRNKVAADEAFMEAFDKEGFPVTIIKPSTTFGPKMGLLRQIAWDFSWLNRVLEGRPILICGDGVAIHQFMHVEDAGRCFAHVLGKKKCIGQIYNMVGPGYVSWRKYHETAMKVLGRSVEMVGVNTADLEKLGVPNFEICRDIFSHNCYYSHDKLLRDVPEFKVQLSLEEGMAGVFESMRTRNAIPRSEPGGWEDRIIEKMRRVVG